MYSLDDYIPIGCLTISSGTATNYSLDSYWKQIDLASEDWPGLSAHLPQSVRSLVQFDWVRLLTSPADHGTTVVRIYVLSERYSCTLKGGKRQKIEKALQDLLPRLGTSPLTWKGETDHTRAELFDPWATPVDLSLYYLFNTLPSPDPNPSSISDRYSRKIVEELLQDCRLPDLTTTLYPFQARAAAAMIQREVAPSRHLDPRYERRTAPDGTGFYYNPQELAFSRFPDYFEQSTGGILAETMGLGKTLICLAVIVATRHHLPKVPGEYLIKKSAPTSVRSLVELAARRANDRAIPAKAHFWRLERERMEFSSQCLKHIEANPTTYLVPSPAPLRVNSRRPLPPSKEKTTCSTTIIVVPRNLVAQWHSQIQKHILRGSKDALKVRVIDKSVAGLPPASVLATYDILLFSKRSFENERRDGKDQYGNTMSTKRAECRCSYIGASNELDCRCTKLSDIYSSPLKELHFLRIIVDEGHELASKDSNALEVARFVSAERRWIVSGTPGKNKLFGVEVDLASSAELDALTMEFLDDSEGDETPSPITGRSPMKTSAKAMRQALSRRKDFQKDEEAKGAAKSIGFLAKGFLQTALWAETGTSKDVWDLHNYRHEDYNKRTYTAFSSCFQQTLQSLVIKTRPEVVEKELALPSLEHKPVYLDPSFYDKLTMNLFLLVITANAVTSERTDVDYLFHPKSLKPRHQLISNLRQSAFCWTGFSAAHVSGAISHATRYLEKQDTNCAPEDRDVLKSAIAFAKMVLRTRGWEALCQAHEVGLFVAGWPTKVWNWDFLHGKDAVTMVGVTQMLIAQKHVNDQLFDEDPVANLSSLSEAVAMDIIARAEEEETIRKQKAASDNITSKTNGSKSSTGESAAAGRGILDGFLSQTQKQTRYTKDKLQPKITADDSPGSSTDHDSSGNSSTTWVTNIIEEARTRKRRPSFNTRELPPTSPLAKARITGTTSAKLSYTLSRVMSLYATEKLLIFYDGDNTAYYLSQCLDLLHIKHLVYAKGLSINLKSKYIVTFDMDNSVRVLLMDIRCGALGLNINAASRIIFINPCCRPYLEAQAIKRCHRIGQTKDVKVETLILKGTIEEQIYNRSQRMTRQEHMDTAHLDDDADVVNIIQNAKMVDVDPSEGRGKRQMVPLESSAQIFGRPGRGKTKIRGIDKDFYDEGAGPYKRPPPIDGESDSLRSKKRRKSTGGGGSDDTDSSASQRTTSSTTEATTSRGGGTRKASKRPDTSSSLSSRTLVSRSRTGSESSSTVIKNDLVPENNNAQTTATLPEVSAMDTVVSGWGSNMFGSLFG